MYWMPKAESKAVTITQKERGVLRELASKYTEITMADGQKEIKSRMFAINDLKSVRPIVLIDEVPWHEINVDGRLDCQCENELAVSMETFFRRALLQWDYFPCDRYFEDYYPLPKSYTIYGGLSADEDVLIINGKNHIVSHNYHDQLRDESDLEKLTPPKVEAYPNIDRERLELTSEILGGILPVRMQGVDLWHSPWDEIPTLHGGVVQVFIDLITQRVPDLLQDYKIKYSSGLDDTDFNRLFRFRGFKAEPPSLYLPSLLPLTKSKILIRFSCT